MWRDKKIGLGQEKTNGPTAKTVAGKNGQYFVRMAGTLQTWVTASVAGKKVTKVGLVKKVDSVLDNASKLINQGQW